VTFKGLIAATAALALTATPTLAAASTARAAADLAPAAETVDGSELDGGANVVVAILALIAAGLGLWVILDDSHDEPVSP
jgi:hypothetical protein